jgi:hypothetical protein
MLRNIIPFDFRIGSNKAVATDYMKNSFKLGAVFFF